MTILTNLDWQKDRIIHITTKHHVTPPEVEEVCFANPFIRRGRGKKGKHVYQAFGQTSVGRYLFIILKPLGGGKARPITARDMTPSERRRYLER